MRPASELAQHARHLSGIFTDIDDTLTHEGVLVPEAFAALTAARRAGLRIVPVTGRPAGWAAVLASTWPVDAVIAENGAVAFAFRREFGHVTLDRFYWDDEATRVRDKQRLDRIVDDVLRSVPGATPAIDNWLRLCDVSFDIGETRGAPPDEIDAIEACIRAHGATAVRSTVHVHAFFGEHDKAQMSVRMAQILFGENLDADRSRWLFVGDSPNDQAGFAYFPVSAGVANVRRYLDRLPTPPAFVAHSPGGHGFAEIVSAILSAS